MTTNDNHQTEEKPMNLVENIDEFEENESQVRSSKQTESRELGKLYEALAKSQLEMEEAKKDNLNPYFKSKFADLASIVRASRPFLAKNGICVIQQTLTDKDGKIFLHSRLGHPSGQWIDSNMLVNPPKNDIQTLGSYLTYLKRYMYAAQTGVVASDEDDDGEEAMKEPRKGNMPSTETSTITKAQLQVLSGELSSHPEILESILKGLSIQKLSDLPAIKYTKCIERIRSIKRAKED